VEEERHPLPEDKLARCPAGCGRPIDFTLPLPACRDCGKRLCLRCVKWWPVNEDFTSENFDIPLCKHDRQARQILRSQGIDRDEIT